MSSRRETPDEEYVDDDDEIINQDAEAEEDELDMTPGPDDDDEDEARLGQAPAWGHVRLPCHPQRGQEALFHPPPRCHAQQAALSEIARAERERLRQQEQQKAAALARMREESNALAAAGEVGRARHPAAWQFGRGGAPTAAAGRGAGLRGAVRAENAARTTAPALRQLLLFVASRGNRRRRLAACSCCFGNATPQRPPLRAHPPGPPRPLLSRPPPRPHTHTPKADRTEKRLQFLLMQAEIFQHFAPGTLEKAKKQ